MLRTEIENKYLEKMARCLTGDTECDHVNADELLHDLLCELGYHALAAMYIGIPKWYA